MIAASFGSSARAEQYGVLEGYTVLLTGSNDAYSELLYPDVKFSYLRDLAPVAGISTLACVMVVKPAFPAMSVPEFVAYAKANPGQGQSCVGRHRIDATHDR
jgi:tripartite-type tricarboxylate transporter receptor subunit TctC